MNANQTLCYKVSDGMLCRFCKSANTVKNGTTKNKKQQYLCKQCGKRFIEHYTYRAYRPYINKQIVTLTKEGLGIRSIARVLAVSATTILKRIIAIARTVAKPAISKGKTYEVDEINTFIKRKSKKIWIAYALERASKTVVNFRIGARTNKTLNYVLKTLTHSNAKQIYTDGLKNYKYLIDQKIHRVTRYGTNHIERNNLTLRTHLKRLNRKTICFSRSLVVLAAVLKIYFWG
ncbi:IS1 family transposase [Flavobacterium dauae]|uniref:IS1 family transposase n=1 Tax=Flavobacterium dauae TaxID=1563479 RepID=UPI00101DDFCB|nr:IS1 family transposase [Flavobacterium dauae]WLD23775.1 IS1 family transposase [Flavobacterium dauae]